MLRASNYFSESNWEKVPAACITISQAECEPVASRKESPFYWLCSWQVWSCPQYVHSWFKKKSWPKKTKKFSSRLKLVSNPYPLLLEKEMINAAQIYEPVASRKESPFYWLCSWQVWSCPQHGQSRFKKSLVIQGSHFYATSIQLF